MDWVPLVLIVFKLTVFCTAAFFAIKWHYDQDKKAKERKESESQAQTQGSPLP